MVWALILAALCIAQVVVLAGVARVRSLRWSNPNIAKKNWPIIKFLDLVELLVSTALKDLSYI